MSDIIATARAAIWEIVASSLRKNTKEVCDSKQVFHGELPQHDLQKIRKDMAERTEAIIGSMKPDVDKIPQELLGYPERLGAYVSDIFVRHFRTRIQEEQKEPGNLLKRLNTDALIEACIADSKKWLQAANKPIAAVEEAIDTGEFARAEQIIRGSLAVDPEDIGMHNRLFVLALMSGNVNLLLEVRRMAKERPNFAMAAEMVDKEAIAGFLHKAVAENIVVMANPLAQPGLIVDGKRLSGSQTENITNAVEAIVLQAAENVIKQFVETDAWTPESFIQMCRKAILERTKAHETWMLGTKFYVQWKGEKLPPWMARRIQTV